MSGPFGVASRERPVKRRGVEIGLLLFGVAFLALVVFSFRPGSRAPARRLPASEVPPPRDAGPVTTLSSGFDFTESLRGRPLFHIKAGKTAGFGAGAAAGMAAELYAGENVLLTVYPEDGQPVTVHSERAEYDARTHAATLEGNVRWSDGKGALAETGRVAFRSADRALEAPGALHFSRGGFDLRARSGRYDVDGRTLALSGPIEGSGAGSSASSGFSTVTADSALYRKDEGVIELVGRVRARSGDGDSIESERLVLKIGEPEGRLTWARATRAVRGVVGTGRLPGSRSTPRAFSGEEAAFFFDDAGQVKSLTLSGSPATAQEAGRKITAKTIELEFAGRRAVAARARGEVAVAAGEERAYAETGELSFGEDGGVEGLSLSGKARLDGQGRSGRADHAVEVPGRGLWILTGDASSSATVEEGGSRISAPRIEIDDKKKIVRAEGGNVRAVLAPARGERANATLVGDSSRPTFAKAERMVLDQTSGTATLSGGAALWQDASALFGRDVTVNDAEHSVVAVGDVRAMLAPGALSAHADEKAPTLLTAGRLIYRETGREGGGESAGSVTLEEGVTAVRGSWRARGKTGAVSLGKDRKVETLELWGAVSLSDQAAGRTGQAEHAVDLPAEGKTILEGTPARVTDREGNRVAGATLTILDRGRRVEVTAPEGGKTETIHQTRRD
jgi:lipopolysaccharide export system protein LptA